MTSKQKDERPSVRTHDDDGKYWDRSDSERSYVQAYVKAQQEAGEPAVMRFVLRDGKTVSGLFVEMGMYSYVIDANAGGKQLQRVIVYKHAIDYMLLGGTP